MKTGKGRVIHCNEPGDVTNDVAIFFGHVRDHTSYYRLGILADGPENYMDESNDAFFLLARSHPQYQAVHRASTWLCRLVYSGFGHTGSNGRYYPVKVFKIHPVRELERREL